MTKPLGLRTDSLPVEQPANSARYVLNGVIDSPSGDVMNYQNELGTNLIKQLSYSPIGHININNDVVIFSTDNTTSEIGILSNDIYTTLITTDCLGFQTSAMIKGEYKILNGCDRVIYWNDNLNPDRSINIDQLTDYQNSNGDWDCNFMKLNPDYLIPYISDLTINDTGGSLDSGSYAFAVEILDDNLNSIVVGLATDYIPVYADKLNSDYESIHGSFSQTVNTVEGGAITSKSFNLTLSNLDTRFKYARLLISARNSNRGLAEEAYEAVEYYPITDSNLDIVFNSLDNVTRIDIERFKIKNPKYTTSKVLEQVDGRLVRANVRTNSRDYSAYQRVVNQINTLWQRKEGRPFDITNISNTKNPKSYFSGNTFIGDEIYAFGIVYIFQDGSYSPVFHIPGRAANVNDTSLLTVADAPTSGNTVSLEDVAHLNLEVGDTIPRWKFYNTFTTSFTQPNLGYHESTSTYPTTLGCDNLPIYGDLSGQPIRHHRFPDRRNYPTQYLNSAGETRLNQFGVNFSNISYPDSDIVGHFFVKAKRTESNKTVIDQGVIFSYQQTINDLEVYDFNRPGLNNEEESLIYAIASPKTFMELNNTADHIHIVKNYTFDNDPEVGATGSYNGGDIEVLSFRTRFNVSNTESQSYYRSLVNQVDVGPNSIYNGVFDKPVSNTSYSNIRNIVQVNSDIDSPNSLLTTVTLKRNISPYSNLYQLQYEPITQPLTLTSSQVTYRGGGFINHFEHNDITLITESTSGLFNNQTEFNVTSDFYRGVWLESDVNYELVSEGTDCNTQYVYPNNPADYILTKVATYDGTDWVLRAGVCQEYYGYNLDFQPANPGEIFLPVPFNFDYCSVCLNKFPNRIIWSPKSFSEEISDSYRTNLVNDYVVVGENKGEINALHYDKNRMLVITESTCLILTPNPRVINTDVDTAYIGTGDFLSIPAVEFSKADYGFGGTQSRHANVNTEFGFFWCDQKAGRIFQFNGDIKELTSKEFGNYAFFRANLPTENSGDSTVQGIGLQMIYDPYYKRVVLHKSDFKPVQQTTSTDYSNTDLFENLGFTISYSPELNSWLSFHSWQPEYMFNDRNYLYSTYTQGIYKHNNSITKYYNLKFPFVIEYVAANPNTSTLEVIAYYAQTLDGSLDVAYPTFDQFWAYSANQSTGIQNLIPKTDYPQFWNNQTKTVVHAEDNYRISAIRDTSIGDPVVSINWEDRQEQYIGRQGYVDKVPININPNPVQYNQIPLRNKYHIIRLIYNSEPKIVFNLTESITKLSTL